MAKSVPFQESFSAGEITPKLASRTQFPKYTSGVETMTNAIPSVYGATSTRVGSTFVDYSTDGKVSRLFNFSFSKEDSLIMAFSDQLIKFISNGSYIGDDSVTYNDLDIAYDFGDGTLEDFTDQSTVGSITVSTTSVSSNKFISSENQLSGLSIARLTKTFAYTSSYSLRIHVDHSDANFLVKIGTTPGGTEIDSYFITSEGIHERRFNPTATSQTLYIDLEANIGTGGVLKVSRVELFQSEYALTSPYAEADLDDLSLVQVGDDVYIAHKDYFPRKLTRTTNGAWTLEEMVFSPPPIYEDGKTSGSITISLSGTSGTITATASADLFRMADVGRQLLQTGSNTGVGTISQYISTTQVTVETIDTYSSTSLSTDWLIDLSPVAELDVDGGSLGSIVTIIGRSVYGNPAISNSTFDNGVGGWINSIGLTWDATNRTLQIAHDGANAGETYIALNHTYNARYFMQFIASGSNNSAVRVGTSALGSDILAAQFFNPGKGATYEYTFNHHLLQDSVFITFSSGTTPGDITNIDNFFIENDVTFLQSANDSGKFIVYNGGCLEILSIGGGNNSATCLVHKTLNNLDQNSNWQMGSVTWNSTRGYPRCVGTFQGRLVFGGTVAQPNTIWLSEIGIPDGFGVGPDVEDAIELTLSGKVNEINWFDDSRDLIIGTSGEELTVSGSVSGISITADTARKVPRTKVGSVIQQPMRLGNETLYITGNRRAINSFVYSFQIDGYKSSNLIKLSDHMTKSGIKEAVFIQRPEPRIYAVLLNGDMLIGTYDASENVVGWSRATTDGKYKSVSYISSSEDDDIYVVVEREYPAEDGTCVMRTANFIERFQDDLDVNEMTSWLDCSLPISNEYTTPGWEVEYDAVEGTLIITDTSFIASGSITCRFKDMVLETGTATLDINNTLFTATKSGGKILLTYWDGDSYENTGTLFGNTFDETDAKVFKGVTEYVNYHWLNRMQVTVSKEGILDDSSTYYITNGKLTLGSPGYVVNAGLPYTTTITTLRPNIQEAGLFQGQQQRRVNPILRVYNSTLPNLVYNGSNIPPSFNPDPEYTLGLALYTGDVGYGSNGYDKEGRLTITTTAPSRITVQGIYGAAYTGMK